MNKRGIWVDIPILNRRQVFIGILLAAMRGQTDFGIAQTAHLFIGNTAPVARYHRIGSRKTVRQIHGYHIKLRGRTTL